MQHSFDIDIATEYGVLEAILLNNMWFWIEKNKANDTNYYDGHYWTYNSTRAFAELFPYASSRKISNALKRLIEEGVLITGNYNKVAYDRTLWYAFTKKGECIMQKCKMEDTKMSNGIVENVEPIPDINTDIKPNSKPNINISSIFEQEFEEIWSMYPKKQGKSNALKAYIKARKNETSKEDVWIGLGNYIAYIKANKTATQYIKNGSTWFNQECWNDDYSVIETKQQNNNQYVNQGRGNPFFDLLREEGKM